MDSYQVKILNSLFARTQIKMLEEDQNFIFAIVVGYAESLKAEESHRLFLYKVIQSLEK